MQKAGIADTCDHSSSSQSSNFVSRTPDGSPGLAQERLDARTVSSQQSAPVDTSLEDLHPPSQTLHARILKSNEQM